MKCTRDRAQVGIFVALQLTVAIVLAGCNTIEGVGKDISGAGQGMADLASDLNPENN